jgi:hypothetical protein
VDRKRIFKLMSLVALAGALLAARPLAQRWPKEQTIHYVLGDAAGRVTELDARWADGNARAASGDPADEAWARQATFHYDSGTAPRIVTHVPRLPDGDYTVEIDLVSAHERSTVTRHVTLAGGSTSLDLVQAVPR